MTTIQGHPLPELPAWAVLQRRLFDEIEDAWRLFSSTFAEPDGRLRFAADFVDRDGVDDLYEPFFNWPAFYLLGGSDEVLAAAKRHWEGVTAQLSDAGMLTDEYENGYDWFHQGESLLFFYGLCAADPGDRDFAGRARRFAELYTDAAHGNFDAELRIIRAPHNGALGPRPGLSDEPEPYSADRAEMRPYGLPLHFVPGVDEWEDLADPARAAAMGEAMHRAAAGDVAVNLAATSLVVNRWLYDGDEDSADWIRAYVDGWRARAAANGGLLPDSVAPDGNTGGLHDGRWYGGHYGWTWPHGLPSVGMAAVIAGIDEAFVTGDDGALDPARVLLDAVLDEAIVAPIAETPFSLRGGWLARWGTDAAKPALLVPHRYGRHGWFDYGPMPLELPLWVWWWSRRDDDLARVHRAIAGLPEMDDPVKAFRDKAEAGHEAPWLAYLEGELPDYPARALAMALGQVARRVALMAEAETDPDAAHLHFGQRVNPVVTEVLSQLVSGTPQVLYNGGLPFAAVVYEDADRGRPGLPPDVAALVSRLDGDEIDLALVNTSTTRSRRVTVRASRFGERRICGVTVRTETGGTYPGRSTAYAATPGAPSALIPDLDSDAVEVELRPAHRVDLTLRTAASGAAPRHRGAASVLVPFPSTALELPVRGGAYRRADAETIRELERVSSATACAKLHGMGITRSFVEGPRPLAEGQRVVGSAITLQFMPQREDLASGHGQEYVERHTALWHVLEEVKPGDVLVIQAFGSRYSGCIGDILARYFLRKGGVGIVVDGRIRDSDRIRDLGLPVWSTGTTPHYASQTELFPWAYDVPVAVGGALCMPGDVVIADGDGPVIVPQAMAGSVVESAQDHEDWESFSRLRLDEGARLSDYYPLTPDSREEYELWRSAQAFAR